MRVLVTGHLGYIGTVMVPFLQSYGHEVVGFDTGFFEDCSLGSLPPEVPATRQDIRDIQSGGLRGFEAIIHLAALSNDPLGSLDPELTYEINLKATVRLAQMARAEGVQRFLYSSSCSIYGAQSADDLMDEEACLSPVTPYAESKVKAEEGLSALADQEFSPVFLRNATAYGFSPRLRGDVVLNNLAAWAFTTGQVRIMSDGSPWRPVVHVEDICRAFALCLAAPREQVHDQAINIGCNAENYQVRDLAEIVRETVPGSSVYYSGETGPDPRNYRVDFAKLQRLIPDFKPHWNARLGAQQLCAAFREHQLSLADFEGRKYIRLRQLKHLISTSQLDKTLRWKTR